MPAKVAEVDWQVVDDHLPTSYSPACRKMRSEIFKEMDASGNLKLSITECMAGLPGLLDGGIVPITDMRPAIKCAFACARDLEPHKKKKGRRDAPDTSVDPTEFHALLCAFRQYLELAVIFEGIDEDKSKLLNYHQCKAALPLLGRWGLTAKQVKDKFPDEWTQTMKFEEFAGWCISTCFRGGLHLVLDDSDNEEVQTFAAAALMNDAAGCSFGDSRAGSVLEEAQNMRKVREAFGEWDTDQSGKISLDEVSIVLMRLNPEFDREAITGIFKTADLDKDGQLNYDEFASWLFKE